MIDLIDIGVLSFLFILLSLPITYRTTNKLTYSLLNLANSQGCPSLHGIILHVIIFALCFYFYMKNIAATESFNICDPGYKLSKALNSYESPFKSWCEYGTEKDNEELSDNKKKQTKSCEVDYTLDADANDKYHTDRTSWCKLKD